jgi:Rps23 Pro-64 3,4-dihydroxylase Tpa1-like proline 4-hydroxylase
MEFILEIPNNLSSNVCKELIKRFEEDPDKFPGLVASGKAEPKIKRSVDLRLSGNKRFDDLDKVLYERLKVGLSEYQKHVKSTLKHIDNIETMFVPMLRDVVDTGYQMQRIKKGDFYVWHSDYSPNSDRLIAFIWYLNTIEDGIGGTTDFYINKSINPEEGKLLFFPATWTYIHRGAKIETDATKYIITGFIVNSNKGIVS